VRAEAAVEMNFDRVNETQERYDPEGQVVRSSQTVNANSRSTEATNTVSVQNNLPNADAGNSNAAGSQEGRQEETTNYEIGRTVRTLIREQPQIRRISIAVMVDGTEADGPDGKPVWTPRSSEEVARITNLVRSAIGYNEQRGDHVEIVSMRFTGTDETTTREPDGVLGMRFDRADAMRLAQTIVLGLVGALTLLFVLRPMVLRLSAVSQEPFAGEAVTAATQKLPGRAERVGGAAATPDGSGQTGLLGEDDMITLANVEGQMHASSIRRIGELVEQHPEASLSIVRGWIAQGAG
jgi:flagellar M-ring protein FliF